jgi:hypothetical protein
MTDRKTILLVKLAQDLGRLVAIKEAGYLLEDVGKWGLRRLMPIAIPAGIGAALADENHRLEGAGLGAIGGMIGSSLFHTPMTKMVADPAVQKVIAESGGKLNKARKSIQERAPDLLANFNRAEDTSGWIGRIAGGAAGGLGTKYLMAPKKTSPEFGEMPTANYDLGGRYSGLLPEDAYEYGVW